MKDNLTESESITKSKKTYKAFLLGGSFIILFSIVIFALKQKK